MSHFFYHRPSMVANFDEKYGKNSKGKSDKCFDNLSEVPDRLGKNYKIICVCIHEGTNIERMHVKV